MDARKWQRLRNLLDQALDLPPQQRQNFLRHLPEDFAELRDDLRRLLSQQERTQRLFDNNAVGLAAQVLRDEDTRAADETLGRQFGAYRLTRLLGVGGMGMVYLAERAHGKFTQSVALKVVQTAMGAAGHERFERERQILAGLMHPNIAALYDGGELPDGQAFYTMEYVDGVPITLYCVEAACSVDERVRLLRDVAAALAYAHRNLVVHRDIKPSNILVTDAGQIKLLDFGIAKLIGNTNDPALTRTAAAPMTANYAAPEQFRNEVITVATDVYQLGMLFFQLLTGTTPYRADPADTYAWARAVAEEEPMTLPRALDPVLTHSVWGDAVDVPRLRRQLGGDLDAIVRKMLSKLPANRYGSMDALVADLDAFLQHRPVAARRPSLLYTLARFVSRHRYAVSSAIIVILFLCATVVFALHQASTATREAERANAVADFLVGLFQVSDPGVNRGEKLNANQILERGATHLEKELTRQPLQRARLFAMIGEVYSALGDFPRARKPLQESIDIQRNATDADPLDFGHALRAMAWITHRQGDSRAALNLLDEADTLLQIDSPRALDERATVHSYKALALKALGDFATARVEFASALAFADRAGTADSVKAAAIHNNLGLLLRDRGDPKAARVELERALAIYRRDYGEDHYRTTGTEQNLAMLLMDIGDADAARPLLEATGARNLALFGEANSDYANAQNMLGNIDRGAGNYDQALQHYATADRAYRAALGDNHAYVAFPENNAGELELRRGNFAAALIRFDHALILRRHALAADHPELADSLASRSQALLGLQRYDEAARDAEEALKIRRAKLDPDSPAVVQNLYQLGLLRYALGDSAAKPLWDEAIERASRVYPVDSAAMRDLRRNIADPAAALRNSSKAVAGD
ncbi:serine/threonine-protein kinase [Pseudolysobacter antarcticus]|nr:serine/threonine-protein kinase [Pseudolysobacter antarcticus]